MRTLLLAVFAIFLALGSAAQITTEPQLPVASKPVTLTFNSAKDPKLELFTADLYAHTGVIVEGKTEWQHVIGQWKQNDVQPKLTNKGNGVYELVVSPDINTFYSVEKSEKVTRMAFVFRSADGSKQTNDLFVDVFEEGFVVNLACDFTGRIFDLGKAYSWEANSSNDASLSLVFNQQTLATGTGKKLTASYTFTSAGLAWMVARAEHQGQVVWDSVQVFVRENTLLAALPIGSAKGISYPTAQSARLVLWAPGKSFVFVVGDFNNWLFQNKFQMKRDGDFFWLDIDNLESYKEYGFQYVIDGLVQVADPYSAKILDPWNDKDIKTETYPGLLAYPTGKTTGIASVLQTGKAKFNWEAKNFVMPSTEKLVIYEMLIRDFTNEHTYESVIGKLDYLKDLRVNVLELMPVNEFEGNSSWGYNPSFYFAADKYYGRSDDLKKLVDECHKRGIAVVVDMVLNHSYGQSPLVQMYMDNWTITSANPWYNVKSNFQNTSLSWGYDFNHDNPATRELIDSVNSFWINEFKVDGFRFDFTKGFSNTPYGPDSWGSAYDAHRVANLKRMADEIWKRKPGALVICEHLADNSEEKELANYGMLLWGNMNGAYREAARGGNADFSQGIFSSRGWSKANLVTYMESHDEERVVYTAKTSGLSGGSYNIRNLTTALQRQELNSLFLLPLPGPKMIWQFGELGYDYSIDFNGRLGEKPILWNFTQNSGRANLFRVMAKLNHLKQQYEEFTPEQAEYGLNGTVKWYRLSSGGQHVLAVGNFGLTETTTIMNFPTTGVWYDYFGGTNINVTQQNTAISLLPGAYKLYSTRQFSVPDIRVSVSESVIPQEQIRFYPNPAQNNLTVEMEKASSLTLFSGTGKLIRRIPNESQETMLTVDLDGLPRGVYLVKVNEANGQQNFFRFLKQ